MDLDEAISEISEDTAITQTSSGHSGKSKGRKSKENYHVLTIPILW